MLTYIDKLIVQIFHIKNEYINYILPIFLVILSIPIYLLLKKILMWIIGLYLSKKNKIDKVSLKRLFLPFQKRFFLFFFLILIYLIFNPLLKNHDFKKYFDYGFSILISISVAQVLITLIDIILKAKFIEHLDKSETKKGLKTVGFISKFVIWLITIILVLNVLGVKIDSLLTGLGISGVIIALATQSIFNDLFSYISILADKPFEVGDFVSFDNLTGTVEQIGIKSTRIRILDGEQLIIPNTLLTGSKLRNFKNLEKRRVFIQLKLPIDTQYKKLEKLKISIQKIVSTHKEAELERCFITTISDMTIQLDTYYYILTKEFLDFLRIKHEVNLEILKMLQKEKIRLVSNIQTLNFYDKTIDKE